MRIAERELEPRPATSCWRPRGIPHTYRVESSNPVRCLTITARGDFERFIRAMSRPVQHPHLSPPAGPPSPQQIAVITATAAKFGIEILGPPLD